MKLQTKLILLNGLTLSIALVGFMAFQSWQTVNFANRIQDESLMQRLRQFENRFRGGPGEPPREPGANSTQQREPRGQGPGPGQRRGPPPLPEQPGWLVRILNAQGEVLAPGGESSAIDIKLFKRSIKGEPLFVDRNIEGVSFRVLSAPVRNPMGETEVIQVARENSGILLLRQAQLWSGLALIPTIGLVALGLGWWLSRQVVRPLAVMTRTAESIADHPEASDRIPVGSMDEIGRLGAALNSMTDSLQKSKAEVSAALEQQKRFSSDAAHELRTPLAGIRLAIENALHPQATVEEQKRALETVDRLSNNMTKLTEMLLALSRLDRGGAVLPTACIDPVVAVQSALEVAGLSHDARVRVVSAVEIKVEANEGALVQILRNLLENAARFTPGNGIIEIRVLPGMIELSDTGPGIDPEHLPHLFDRFYRADSSRTGASGGHGLGLAIARQLANQTGAELKVESTPGVGTTFSLRFSKSPISS